MNKYRELRRRKSIKVVDASTSELGNIPDPAAEFWDTLYPGQLVARAMQMAEPMFETATWKALNEYVRGECSANEAAEKYAVSVWTVYSAKSRLLAHLREQLEGLLE